MCPGGIIVFIVDSSSVVAGAAALKARARITQPSTAAQRVTLSVAAKITDRQHQQDDNQDHNRAAQQQR